MASRAPSPASRRAMSKPSPREPPVITTVRPQKSNRRNCDTTARYAAYPPATDAETTSAFFQVDSGVIGSALHVGREALNYGPIGVVGEPTEPPELPAAPNVCPW